MFKWLIIKIVIPTLKNILRWWWQNYSFLWWCLNNKLAFSISLSTGWWFNPCLQRSWNSVHFSPQNEGRLKFVNFTWFFHFLSSNKFWLNFINIIMGWSGPERFRREGLTAIKFSIFITLHGRKLSIHIPGQIHRQYFRLFDYIAKPSIWKDFHSNFSDDFSHKLFFVVRRSFGS